MEDHVGGGDQLQRARRHQPRVAGAGADQVDDPGGVRSSPPPRRARISRAPAASIRSASASPSAAGCSGSPATRSRTHSRAVGQAGVAADHELVARRRARRRRPACRSSPRAPATAARSAVSSTSAPRRSSAPPPRRAVGVVRARLERQAALAGRRGHLRRGRTRNAISSVAAEPPSPAAASTIPSSRRRRACARRVSTLPRSSTISRSGRSASSCERRRRLAVPTRAPSGPRRASPRRRSNASAGSSRPGTPTSASPSGSSPGRSLARVDGEVDLAVEQRALDPADEARLVADVAVGGARPRPSRRRRARRRRRSAWASARALPRVPSRSSLTGRGRAARAALAEVARPRRRGASSGSVAGVETEQLAQRRDLLVGVGLLGGALQPQRRLVQEPAGDRARHRARAARGRPR